MVGTRTTGRGSRIVLVLPTDGYRTSAFFEAAAALGVDVVVATEEPPPLAPGMEDRLVLVDFDRPEASAASIVALAERLPVDAVVGVDDRGVLTAALSNELLGLVCNPPDAVAATRDKIDMRAIFASWSIPQPSFRVVRPGAEVAALAEQVGLPCVVKPVSLSASVGVIRADTAVAAVEVERRVRQILTRHDRPDDEPLLVERFIAGAEVSVEGLMDDGHLEVLAVFDKPDPLDGPYFEETIYVTPSRLSPQRHAAVLEVVARACRALGLRNGPIHAEVRVGDDDPDGSPRVWVLEVAARSIGGQCSRALRFGTDVTLEELILRNAMGLGTQGMSRSDAASGAMMVPIPRSGLLVEVTGVEAARSVPGIVGVEITATRGRPIEALPSGGRYLGFIFARGDTPAEVEAALREAHSRLDATIVDEPVAS